jgi:DNA-binding SARP family transcriptional activator
VFAHPDQVGFAHARVARSIAHVQSENHLQRVAALIVSDDQLRRDITRWMLDSDVHSVVLGQLPEPGSSQREDIVGVLTSLAVRRLAEMDNKDVREVLERQLRMREHLTSREVAKTLWALSRANISLGRYSEAETQALQVVELTESVPQCRDMRAIALVELARARFRTDRSLDVTDLLDEAETALVQVVDRSERLAAELHVARLWLDLVAGTNRLADIVQRGDRAYRLAGQLGLYAQQYKHFESMMLAVARLRDHDLIETYGRILLEDIRKSATLSFDFTVVANTIRAVLIIGHMFLGRELFEAWNERFSPVGVKDFMEYSRTTALFASLDGNHSLAADLALDGISEFRRFRSTSGALTYPHFVAYYGLQAQVLTALFASGRYVAARELIEELIETTQASEVQIYAQVQFLHLVRAWLEWRCLLPIATPTSLHSYIPAEATEDPGDQLSEALESDAVDQAASAVRALYDTIVDQLPYQAQFQAAMMLAKMAAIERDFECAVQMVDRANDACTHAYSWSFDLEGRSAHIVAHLRWAAAEPGHAKDLVRHTIEKARELFSMIAEQGMTGKIEHLKTLFVYEAEKVPKLSGRFRDLPGQFDRLGTAYHATAHQVQRNSGAETQGALDRARLFLMGPIRLMQPYSYMELSETEFERKSTRTLLVALVSAAVLGRRFTREELTARISQSETTSANQRKPLYNAVTAARAACGSSDSIIAVGSNSLELNTNLAMQGSVWVDALELIDSIDKAEQYESEDATSHAFETYKRALLLVRKGEFASDSYETWVDAARDHIREKVRLATLAFGRLAIRTGRFEDGIEEAVLQLARDPFDEEMHRLLMELYHEAGNRSAALRQFDKCRQMLRHEFDVEPEQQTIRLRQRIAGLDR